MNFDATNKHVLDQFPRTEFYKKLYNSGKGFVSKSFSTFLPGIDHAALCAKIRSMISGNSYTLTYDYRCYVIADMTFVEVFGYHEKGGNFEIAVLTNDELVVPRLKKELEKKRDSSTIYWQFLTDEKKLSSMSTSLYMRETIYAENYPFLNKPFETYGKDYMESDASVLLLIGPPGTGKTSFITHLLTTTNSNAFVVYDEEVMAKDSMFASFLESWHSNVLIIEDADSIIRPRENNNGLMSRFLNVSEGLVKTPKKKMIFTTNLSQTRIDEALYRTGRCYDVINFRNLSKEEALKVAEKYGIRKDGIETPISLSDLFGRQSNNFGNVVKKPSFGFTA